MVAVDLVSIYGPDLVTWIWFQFLCVVPLAIVVLQSNCGRKVISLCITDRCITVAYKGHLGPIFPPLLIL